MEVDHHVAISDKVAPQIELIRIFQVHHHEETHPELPSSHVEDRCWCSPGHVAAKPNFVGIRPSLVKPILCLVFMGITLTTAPVSRSPVTSTFSPSVLLRPSWCPYPHVSLIEEVTERVRLSRAKDEDLGYLNLVHKLIPPHRKESEETTSKLDKLMKKMEPGSCVDLVCGGGEHSCDGRSCVRIQFFSEGGFSHVVW